MMFAI